MKGDEGEVHGTRGQYAKAGCKWHSTPRRGMKGDEGEVHGTRDKYVKAFAGLRADARLQARAIMNRHVQLWFLVLMWARVQGQGTS